MTAPTTEEAPPAVPPILMTINLQAPVDALRDDPIKSLIYLQHILGQQVLQLHTALNDPESEESKQLAVAIAQRDAGMPPPLAVVDDEWKEC